MDAAERLLELIIADEGWSWERQQLQDTVSYADMAFFVFKPYINILDPGGPYKTHTITKEARRLNALYWQIKRQGTKPNLKFADGDVFHPWKDYKRHVYGPEHIEKHMTDNEVTYYTSGDRGLGLIYMDVDAHDKYQTDEYDGLALLQELFPDSYYRASRRGQNQYLKVRYSSPEEFNALCDMVQEKVRMLFLSRGILCDFETKGKITTQRKSGSLAKLPFTCPYPCNMRDETDAWNFAALMRFHRSPVYTVEGIGQILDAIVVDGETAMETVQMKAVLKKLERILDNVTGTDAVKKSALDKVKQVLGRIAVMDEESKKQAALEKLDQYINGIAVRYGKDRRSAAPEIVPEPERQQQEETQPIQPGSPAPKQRQSSPAPTAVSFGIVVQSNTTGTADGDAFARNWQVLPGFVRGFYRQHRRFPSTDEALVYLHDNGLFSGAWGDSVNRRRRVASILEKIAQGFKEEMLGTGDRQELNPEKFAWWVRQHFGVCMRATVEQRNCFDAETMTYPKKSVDVPLRFVCGFLAAAEIVIAKTENGRVSTNWFKVMFKQMGITWNQDYYRATRDKLHALGIIQITDRHHRKNVAWTWGSTFNIPASWKEEQRACKAKLVKRDPEELPSFFCDTTVYTNEDAECGSDEVWRPPRPLREVYGAVSWERFCEETDDFYGENTQ